MRKTPTSSDFVSKPEDTDELFKVCGTVIGLAVPWPDRDPEGSMQLHMIYIYIYDICYMHMCIYIYIHIYIYICARSRRYHTMTLRILYLL